MKTVLGIDFGTTTTTIGMTTETSRFEPELIEIDGIRTVESVLRLDPAGERVEQIGDEAWQEISLYPDRTFYAFKPKTGVDYEYKFGSAGRTFTARELDIMFLRIIREKIERQQFNGVSLKDSDVTCVIGYPAEWSNEQKSLIVQVATEAGFPNVVGCEEPLGVVYYHHFKGELSVNEDQIILVYDFGGGTTDVALVRTGKGKLPEIIGFGGINLGGHHFDEKLRQYFSTKISMSLGMAQLTASDQATMRKYTRMIKEKLSVAQSNGTDRAEITIPMLETSRAYYRMILESEEFEGECKNFIERFDEPIESALRKAGIKIDEIDMSIVAGGAGRFYYIRGKIKDAFPDSLKIQSTNPQEVISKGLAIFRCVKEMGDAPPKVAYPPELGVERIQSQESEPPEPKHIQTQRAKVSESETVQPYEAEIPEQKIVQTQGYPAFDQDKFLLRQKYFTISPKYYVWDEEGNTLLFVRRYKKGNIRFYRDDSEQEKLFEVLQFRNIEFFTTTYMMNLPDGQCLATFCKNIFRESYSCYNPDGSLLCVAKLPSFLSPSISIRKRDKFIILRGESDEVIGKFSKKYNPVNRHVVFDMSADRSREIDRRIGIALGTLLYTK